MSKRRGRPPIKSPTPTQIKKRCKEVQATWDEETRISRIADPSLLPYSIPVWHVPIIKTKHLDFADYETANYPDCPFDEDAK